MTKDTADVFGIICLGIGVYERSKQTYTILLYFKFLVGFFLMGGPVAMSHGLPGTSYASSS